MNGQIAGTIRVPLPGGSTAELVGSNGSTKHVLHGDWLGSVRLSTTLVSRTLAYDSAYAPYGENYDAKGSFSYDVSFTGQYQDSLAGLYDFMLREYGPVQGRWMSPDPSGLKAVDPGNPQSWNRYAYVVNTPLSSTDPTGLSCSFLGVGVTNADPDGSDRDFGALNDFGCTRVLTEMASTAKSLFDGYIEQSHAEDRAIYQRTVDCGNNPGSCCDANSETQQPTTGVCTDKILSAGNSRFGTNFTNSNVIGTFVHSTYGPEATQTVNLNISAGSQISSVAPGRYPLNWWTYVFGIGPTLHVPAGPGGFDSDQTIRFGQNNDFTEHLDNAFAGWNPLGDLFHGVIDVLGIGRNRCP